MESDVYLLHIYGQVLELEVELPQEIVSCLEAKKYMSPLYTVCACHQLYTVCAYIEQSMG